MPSLYPVAGMRLYIGSTKNTQNSDFAESDFSSESWVEIDGWSQVGGFGDSAALVTFELVNRSRDEKQKGTSNAGSMENIFAQIDDDAGQLALISAASPSDKNNYAFRVLHVSGAERFFIGVVMSAREVGGTANNPRNLSSTIEINSNIVRVAAS